jgi:hypothetical protein
MFSVICQFLPKKFFFKYSKNLTNSHFKPHTAVLRFRFLSKPFSGFKIKYLNKQRNTTILSSRYTLFSNKTLKWPNNKMDHQSQLCFQTIYLLSKTGCKFRLVHKAEAKESKKQTSTLYKTILIEMEMSVLESHTGSFCVLIDTELNLKYSIIYLDNFLKPVEFLMQRFQHDSWIPLWWSFALEMR